ncbi:MAG: TolC family protein [Bacteroidia bacterium]|nr:TolC family protein [Bacteroidia bacterium]
MKQKFIMLLLLSVLLIQAKAQTIITLEQALEMASKASPSIQSSLFNLERTTETLNAQRAALKSQFSLTLNPMEYSNSRRFDARYSQWYTNKSLTTSGTVRVDQPILYTDGKISLSNQFGWQSNTSASGGVTNENKSYFNNLNLSLTQPLFTYNRLKIQIKTLELNNENAMLSYAMQRLTLEKNVSQYFYNVYLAQMSLSIKQEELANTEKSNEIIKNKVDAGLAAKEELYQSEVNLATSQSGVESGRVSLENAKDQFKQYIGMDIFAEIAVMTDVTVTPIEVDGKKALDHGLASRMELRQRAISVETSQFDMLSVKATNEFRGDMTLSMGLSGDNPKLSNIFDQSTKSPRVSLGFNIPVFDWGERKARIRAQEAVINSQKLNLTNQETQIKIDIRQVIRNLSNLKNQIGIALQNQNNSQLTYDINLERYKNGDLTSMDLNLFQVQLSDKKMAYAQSLINYKIELLNLKIQSLFDFTTNEPVVPEKFVKEYQDGLTK